MCRLQHCVLCYRHTLHVDLQALSLTKCACRLASGGAIFSCVCGGREQFVSKGHHQLNEKCYIHIELT